jgi:hypothetical protein
MLDSLLRIDKQALNDVDDAAFLQLRRSLPLA